MAELSPPPSPEGRARLFLAPARAIGGRLAALIVLNAFALTLPLTAVDLLAVRKLGLENHPEELNAFYAARFTPSMLTALFGLLSDAVDLRRCYGARSASSQSRRALWLLVGLLGSALSLLPIALGAVTSIGWLYATAIPGAVCGALVIATLEGMLVQTGLALAGSLSGGAEGTGRKARSAVQAVDYQLRGLGSLAGFLVTAWVPLSARVAAGAAAACYAMGGLVSARAWVAPANIDTQDRVAAPSEDGPCTAEDSTAALAVAADVQGPVELFEQAPSSEPLEPPATRSCTREVGVVWAVLPKVLLWRRSW